MTHLVGMNNSPQIEWVLIHFCNLSWSYTPSLCLSPIKKIKIDLLFLSKTQLNRIF